jgi:UDP-N-acetylglucosamine--N-acetylmuramyl-(pentapeptide) pyrophosphoryl-undecaprenol N-acetylglucosamine transferase
VASEGPRILLAGGGTGGHLFPALALAEEIRKLRRGAQMLFIGTKGKLEARVVPQRGYPFRTIWISGFHRRLTVENLLFPLKVVVSLVQSLFVIRQFRPDAVIGTGGYVCGPILWVASLLGVPTFVHESNSYPGVTTRMLAGRATRVYIAFEATRRWLKRTDNVELVGTPTRDSLGTVSKEEGRRFFGLGAEGKTVLVFGGSLGATSVNNAILERLDEFHAEGIQLIWQTGEADYQRIRQRVAEKPIGWLGIFIDRMECAFAAADVVVCRAGALTIAELTRVGKAAILIPYPFAAADHQTHNAGSLVDAGAALMIPDREVGQRLKPVLLDLLHDESRVEQMSAASLRLGKPTAGLEIAAKILELAGNR